MEEVRADYKHAVKSAIVDYLFGDTDGSAHLASANVQPVKPEPVIPDLAVVDLKVLPMGVSIIKDDMVRGVRWRGGVKVWR